MCIYMHNKRSRDQERAILLQGVNLPSSQPLAVGPLPFPQEKPVEISDGSSAERHHYVHAENTAGQVHLRRQWESLRNRPVVPLVVYHLPTQAVCTATVHVTHHTTDIHPTTCRHSIFDTKDHSVAHQQEKTTTGPTPPKKSCVQKAVVLYQKLM